jgi:ribosomal protein S8
MLLFKAISLINMGLKKYNKSIIISYNLEVYNFILLLLKLGLISQVFLVNNKRLIILLKYFNNKPVISNILTISRPGYKKNFNLFKYKHLSFSYNTYYILRTSKGFLTQNDVLKYNLTGEVICRIN